MTASVGRQVEETDRAGPIAPVGRVADHDEGAVGRGRVAALAGARGGRCRVSGFGAGATVCSDYAPLAKSLKEFLFPLCRIACTTTRKRVIAADGVFREGAWRVLRRWSASESTLMPTKCDALDSLLRLEETAPRHMIVPSVCREKMVR